MGPLTNSMPLDTHSNNQTYCSIVWIRAVENKTNTKRLERVQGMALKHMAGAMPSKPYTALNYLTGTPHITDYLKGEAAKGAVRLMGQGDWTLETAPSGRGIIKAHSTLSNNFLHTLNINKRDSWDITKPKLVPDHSYTITYPTASLTEDFKNRLNSDIIEASTHGICCFTWYRWQVCYIRHSYKKHYRAFLQNERLLYCLPGQHGSHHVCCRRAYHLQQPTNNLLERQPICTTGSLQ